MIALVGPLHHLDDPACTANLLLCILIDLRIELKNQSPTAMPSNQESAGGGKAAKFVAANPLGPMADPFAGMVSIGAASC